MLDVAWERGSADGTNIATFVETEALLRKIQGLNPGNDSQQFLQSQALSTVTKLPRQDLLWSHRRVLRFPCPY